MAEIIPSRAANEKRAQLSMGREDSERDRAHVDREVDWFFENASPNPDRVGCLSEQTLRELAQRLRPISDPGYEHLAHCSPCYQQFRQLQSQRSSRSTFQPSRRILAVAASIVLIIAAVMTFWWLDRGGASPRGTGSEVAVLDLRSFLVTRGTQSPARAPIKLSRADVRADILLPVGFEAGRYDLRLINGALVTVLSTQADAALENQVVTIHTPMKLRNLHAGQYQLALRRVGEDWHFFSTNLE
jgi:Predicted metal-binding protein